ncbi:MAG: response regulator [Chloroflexi bacterium]|nr:response regulator [Chloroflexota bacterium]
MSTAQRTTILLVEDDEGHALLINMNLRDAGLDNPIVHVTDGQAAVDYIDDATLRGSPSSLMVLLDLNLPVRDGFAVLEWMKTNERTRTIPVIILTSTDDIRDVNRCYALGCNVFLHKPVNYDDFIHAIKQLGLFLSVIELPESSQR